MKRFFVLFCPLAIVTISFCPRAFAAINHSGATLAASPDTTHTAKPDTRLLSIFNDQFPNAEQVAWEILPEAFTVNFFDRGVHTLVTYDKQDNFINSTRYYEERDMPHRLLNVLKKRYSGKSIFAITELTTDSGTEYHIKLQDDKVWLMVTMDSEGNIQNTDEYKKAS